MKIAINIRSARNRGGIGRYTRELARHLIDCFPDNEFRLFGHPDMDVSFIEPKSCWEFIAVPGPDNRPFWETFSLKAAVNSQNPDVFHNPDYTVPAGIKCPSTVTVHDLSFKYFPVGVSLKAKTIYNLLTPQSLRKSDLVIADSHYTKDEIIRAGWKEENKVRVIHLAVNQDFFDPPSDDQLNSFLKKHQLDKGYILYLGAIDKRKNLIGLVQAYSELRAKHTDIPRFVIAGEDIGSESELMEWVHRLGLDNSVKRIGYIPPEQLKVVYSGAMFFVFPSFYEGFGLPPLEAMACKIPVIVSDRTSLPEVVGDAGIVVSIDKTGELTDAMNLLINDTAKRNDLAHKGYERASGFTWEKVAKEVMDVYREIVEHHTGPSHPASPAG